MKKTAIITVTVLAIIAVAVTAFAVTSANKTVAEVSVDSVSNINEESSALEYTAELIEIETETDPALEDAAEVFENIETAEPEEAAEDAEEAEEETIAPESPVFDKPVVRAVEVKASETVRTDRAAIRTNNTKAEVETVYVVFDANGGSVTTTGKTVEVGKAYGNLPAPMHSGHNFLGWFTAREGGEKVTERTIVNTIKNHTLYARWSANRTINEPVCTVTVDFVSSVETDTTLEPIEATYGSCYKELVALKDTDEYHFTGWYTADGRYVQNTSFVEIGQDHTLYAGWEKIA